MGIKVNAIATSAILNEKGVLDLDVKSSKTVTVGTIEQGKELPGENDIIK